MALIIHEEVIIHKTNEIFEKWKWKVKSLSRVWLFVTPWTVAYQASPSMEFSRQEYWSGLPFPSPGDIPDPGMEPGSPALRCFTVWATREAQVIWFIQMNY